MRRGIVALLTAVFVGGVGIAQAAVTTNYFEDFTGTVASYVAGAADVAVTNGIANEVWWLGSAGNATATVAGNITFATKKDDSAAAYYTLPSATLGEASAMSLIFNLSELTADSFYLVVYGIENPGTATDYVGYDAVNKEPGGFETGGLNLTAFGSLASVTELVAPATYTATNVYTVNFNYNGTDDVVIGFAAEKSGNSFKQGVVESVLLTSSDEVSFPAEVSLVSEDLFVDVADGVTTGTVAVSYAVGSAATNVTVTSVSVVDESHSNAFANASTNLPLTLATPGVPEDLLIEFDNTIAGLAAGETATGVVEVVWNEVGSATSSTSTVPVSATRLAVNDSNIIALFDDSFNNADRRLTGLTAVITGGNGADGSRGSNDGDYGTLPGNAPTEGGALKVQKTTPETLTPMVAITNNTGSDVVLDSLHFDVIKRFSATPGAVDVWISGDVTPTNLLDSTIATNFTASNVNLTDYDDFDVWTLTNLADRTLAHGEGLVIEFAFINDGDGGSPTLLDNIAVLGSGSNGAVLSKVAPVGPEIVMGVTGTDTTLSEVLEMSYSEGDAATNIVFNSVSFTNETHGGVFSTSGLIAGLSTPGATSDVVTIEFDNTVANLAIGEEASATLELRWNEVGLGERTYSLPVRAIRPADVPESGVVALFNTEFLVPDAALDGIFGTFERGDVGNGVEAGSGSNDGDYGSLASPAAPTDAGAFQVKNNPNGGNVVTLTVTNQSAGDIVLSSLNFDVGPRNGGSPDAFTLSVSGDVTADPALWVASNLTLVAAVDDYNDFNVPLTNLADNVLGAGESVVFTFTFVTKPEAGLNNNTFLDNVALMTVGGYANWSAGAGLTQGVNDGLTDNPDNDGMDNLMEYATDSDPLTADQAAATWEAEEGSTNWFYHVYAERTDDASLTYTVGSTENLVHIPATNAVSFVGESAVVDNFKTVTNRTDIKVGVPAEFIRLKVDRN